MTISRLSTSSAADHGKFSWTLGMQPAGMKLRSDYSKMLRNVRSAVILLVLGDNLLNSYSVDSLNAFKEGSTQ